MKMMSSAFFRLKFALLTRPGRVVGVTQSVVERGARAVDLQR